jgi:uncharacterized protein (TIGR02996 family)
MTDEDALLAAVLAAPDDDLPRLVYADWLDDHGDPRAEYLRLGVELRRLTSGHERHDPEGRMHDLRGRLDPGWAAVLGTLGEPFRERQFGYNTRRHPFTEPIGRRGPLCTFESQFRTPTPDPGLVEDIRLLHGQDLGSCYYGAGDFPVEPFLTALPSGQDTPTAADVLAALMVRSFRSDHIRDLDRTAIPYPGYHPRTENDEVHTDPLDTHIFPGRDDPGAACPVRDALQGYVRDGRLWYVLLHTWHEPDEYGMYKDGTVVLFAVGVSPHARRLVGVVTAQVCHNLCD